MSADGASEVIYSFCVIEVVPRDRNRAAALVAKLLRGGFVLQNSSYFSVASGNTSVIKAVFTLVRQPSKADGNAQFDQKLIDTQIAEANAGAVGLSVTIA